MTQDVFHRIGAISVVEPFRLRAVFVDGAVKEYDLRFWEHRPDFSLLFRHPVLQKRVQVVPGGYGISYVLYFDDAAGADSTTKDPKELQRK